MSRQQDHGSDSDSDESLSPSVASGRTSVLLGYPDEEVVDTASPLDTRIGGYPVSLLCAIKALL